VAELAGEAGKPGMETDQPAIVSRRGRSQVVVENLAAGSVQKLEGMDVTTYDSAGLSATLAVFKCLL
jgi:hypothetical protein